MIGRGALILSLVLNAALIALVAAEGAQLRKAEGIAGSALDREHRAIAGELRWRASAGAVAAGAHDTDRALDVATGRLAFCLARLVQAEAKRR